ncbi:unnamed protein product [Thelazia callipaeda]|uniref:Histone-lysine N-methyltransferase n=1 Tax=Thelazia callipaeda TaxID=103827 RepID=A0A0N5D232_THECL|nr:unnamed protein product [Thelazia callipaeda]
MGLEAVPCVLRSAASDGNNSSYCTIGFLIRQSTSTNNTAVQAVTSTTVNSTTSIAVASGSAPKSLHVVPATIPKQSASLGTSTPKFVVPSVLRIQPAPCASTHVTSQPTQPIVHHPAPPQPPPIHHHIPPPQQQHCNTDSWLHSASQSNVNNASFESPSPQVVPQMNVNESYDCQMPCTSTTNFFPPISSITQSFSSGKSDIDLLQEMTHHIDLNPPVLQRQQRLHVTDKNEMRLINHNHYAQQHNSSSNTPPPPPQHNYHNCPTMLHISPSTCSSLQTNYQTHVQIDTNSRMQSCHYESSYNVGTDCSSTVDNGIQSIADSPPADPFTPAVPSPSPYISPPSIMPITNRNKEPQLTTNMTNCYDDFSDMPRLIPFHQMETEVAPSFTDETILTTETASNNEIVVGKMNTTKTNASLDAEKDENREHKTKISTNCRKKVMESDDNIPKIAITPAMNVTDLVEQLMSHMDPEQRKQFATAIQSKVAVEDSNFVNDANPAVCDSLTTTTNTLTSKVPGSATEMLIATSASNNNSGSNENDGAIEKPPESLLQKCNNEIEMLSQDRQSCSNQPSSDQITEEAAKLISQVGKKRLDSRKRKMGRCADLSDKLYQQAKRRKSETFIGERKDSLQLESWCDLEFTLQNDYGVCGEGKKQEERVEYIFGRESKKFEETEVVGGREFVENKEVFRKIRGESLNCSSKGTDEYTMNQINEFHANMKRKVNQQLKLVMEQIDQQFAKLELNLGDQMHWDLPWYCLDWKQLTRRLVEKKRLEKSRHKSSLKMLKIAADRKSSNSRNVDLFATNAAPSSSKLCNKNHRSLSDYIKLKQNVVVDASPKIEQMQCSCSQGCCGENDKCINRVVQMECSSSCPRNTLCTNKRLFRRECVERLRTFQTLNGCGIGVKTDVNIEKGQFICEYMGEVVSIETFNIRTRTDYRYQQNHYALNLCPGFVIDAYRKGNIARFINHSCSPNCEMQRWSVNGHYRIGLFALREIFEGEELTYDYNWDAFEFDDVTICCCGAPNCRLFLNKNVIMNTREKEMARNTHLLLLRNLRKSVACKLRKCKRVRNYVECRPRNQSTKTSQSVMLAESGAMHLTQLCQEIVSKLNDSKVISTKEIKKFAKFVAELCEWHGTAIQTVSEVLESIEMKVNTLIEKSSKPLDRRKLDMWRSSYASIKSKYLRQTKKISRADHQLQRQKKCKSGPHRTLTAVIDYKYLDSHISVGSYDHDSLSYLGIADANTDCVRCICGITDDDGSMIQCEECNFWLHEECVFDDKPSKEVKDFICTACVWSAKRTLAISIPLRTQPDYNFKDCTYYRTLVNSRHLQVRLSEAVYVQKLENDNHKLILRRLVECTKENAVRKRVVPVVREKEQTDQEFYPVSFHRKDVQCFRVERLFSFEGHKFVFGFYYARPHEVYCEPGKLFHEKELFATNMYDTLPLDAVVGRCLALEPSIYSLGRPKLPHYEEMDVYFVEYQMGKNSKFEKIPAKNQYCINTDPLNFSLFEKELIIPKTFTPFTIEKGKKYPYRLNVVEPKNSSCDKNQRHRVANLEKVVQNLRVLNIRNSVVKAKESSISNKLSKQKRSRLS